MPYVLLASGYNLTANERYEGFCVELIKEVAQKVGFNYTIRLAPEAKYGIYNPQTGEWNGIVRELMDRVQFLHFLYPLSLIIITRLNFVNNVALI